MFNEEEWRYIKNWMHSKAVEKNSNLRFKKKKKKQTVLLVSLGMAEKILRHSKHYSYVSFMIFTIESII